MRTVSFPRLASPLAMALALAFAVPALGEGYTPVPLTPAAMTPVRLTPDEIQLKSDASRPGSMDIATLAGDLAKPGLYAVRIRLPSQIRVQPHTHPDDRAVVVLAGTVHIGFGERFDPALMRAMPAGSFFVEPARTPHFAWVQGADAIVQASGIGPSGTVYLSSGEAGH